MSGPHGPVFPAGSHQLSFFGRNAILCFGIPRDSQIFEDPISFGASLSPAKTVTANLSTGIFKIFVRNSKENSIASFLK